MFYLRSRWALGLLVACLLLVLSASGYAQGMAQRTLIVRVIDARTEESLPQAILHIGSTKLATDLQGQASLTLPSDVTDGLHVHYIGYHEGFVPLDKLRNSTSPLVVALQPEVRNLARVTVTAQRRTPVSVNSVATKVTADAIQQHMGRSLASLLSEVSGVSMLQTGTTTAKPVIHGMYGTRVLIVNNGVRQSGQQWGDDHAPEVDAESSSSVHVVKGAEAVRYGSEAMAGVVILDQAPLPYGGDPLHGSVAVAGASNGWRGTGSLRLEGALPMYKNLAWRLQTSYTNAGDRQTAHYSLLNTGMRELNYSAALGWRYQRFRLEGYLSRYYNKTGLLPTGHLPSLEDFDEYIQRGQPDLFRPFSREISTPYHSVVHYLGKVKATWSHDLLGSFSAQASLQRDTRQEYAIRRNASYESIPTLDLRLSSLQLEGLWRKHYHNWDSELGLHYEDIDNYNEPGTGFTPPIPNYAQRNWGVHALQRWQTSRLGAELGVRLDQTSLGAAGYDTQGRFIGGDHHFTNLTYSLGGHVHLGSGWELTTNIGAAYRAPHVQELYSYGSQHGSAIFVRGDANLTSERGYKWVTALSHHSDRWDLDLDGYLQWIDGYIYDEPSRQFTQTLGGTYPTFFYRQRDAFFRGVDLDARYFILPRHLYARVQGAMVWANERGTGRYFPYIPALRVSETLGGIYDLSRSAHLEWSLTHRFVDKQRRFDPATDLVESPPAYHLWGAEASLRLSLPHEQQLSIALGADNLFNAQYKEYTNRARYYSHDAGRDVRLSLRWQF